MEESDYLLTNSEPETADRFDGLDEAFDPVSIGHLRRLGVGVGARCLEIGAGSGSIARWLAGVVGPAGHVLALDLDTWPRPWAVSSAWNGTGPGASFAPVVTHCTWSTLMLLALPR